MSIGRFSVTAYNRMVQSQLMVNGTIFSAKPGNCFYTLFTLASSAVKTGGLDYFARLLSSQMVMLM